MSGSLILAATPLGNPEDASVRLRAALASSAVVAAEDTRRARRLAADLGVTISGDVISFYDGVEASRTATLVDRLRAGDDVLVISDAGTPTVSDPGYRLVSAAAEAGLRVSALPGPSAVLTALAVSGLPTDRFCFEGFPPRKAGELHRWLADLADERRTIVFFESPRRLGATLAAAAGAWGGQRAAAVCRELTKTHEEVRRGPIGELAEWAEQGVRGEITVVVAGASGQAAPADPDELRRAVDQRQETGLSRRDAIADVARERGLSRREVYNAAVSQP